MNSKGSFFSRKQFELLIVCVTTGFIIGYSYNQAKDNREAGTINSELFEQEDSYREELITQQERNKELSDELNSLQEQIRKYEKSFASNEKDYKELVEQAEDLRLLLGELKSEGKGIRITLQDGDYDPKSLNPNDYIVHESHVFKLLNELKISGAQAIAINGQRVMANSYIRCNGPVITIDGTQHPAPFVIEAVGDSDTLIASLNLNGGVVDQLLNDNIVVSLEEHQKLTMPRVKVES
ncbi:YlxW [Lysinibacillus sphaericus C3-41]|nr:YlxW [Lysinibacillus sphaericus C3-41]